MGTIRVDQVGKAYKQYSHRWDRLIEWVLPFLGLRHTLKWVIKDISFALAPGDAVGIIGVNGAGKSTLLKLITGTAQPSSGSVVITGRVAALLELGMGFHPDFSGRQNATMAGQLIGLSGEEMINLMPQIEAFADIGDYIDKPVRIYSSGMQVRLAFSVATVKRPDVLIVDEALSVGDAYFQHKSFERIREFKKLGTTLLIVSHDRAAIQSICDRAILLSNGHLAKQGSPDEVMDFYNALIAERATASIGQIVTADGRIQTSSGSGEANVTAITLEGETGAPVEMINVGATVNLRIKVKINSPLPRLVLGYMIKDRLGQQIYGTNTHHLHSPLTGLRAGEAIDYCFHFPLNLGPGSYSITTALTSSETHLGNNYEWRDLAFLFIVINMNRHQFVGTSWLEPRLEIIR